MGSLMGPLDSNLGPTDYERTKLNPLHIPILLLSASGAGSENYHCPVLPSSSLILPAFPSQRRHTRSAIVRLAQRKLVMRTMSLEMEPLATYSCLPSDDQSNEKMRSEVKFVTCRGGPLGSGCRQILPTPFFVRK